MNTCDNCDESRDKCECEEREAEELAEQEKTINNSAEEFLAALSERFAQSDRSFYICSKHKVLRIL